LEERVYKENLKRMILEMAQDEISNYSSQKGVQKYFEGNIDKIINENIKNYLDDISVNKIYSKILKRGSSQENVQSVARVIKSEELFKSKNELVKFARYLGINVNAKSSYTQTLKRISNYIYLNRKEYSEKYVLYRNGDEECILEPEKIKLDLIESYKSKTRKDMKSIARLLDINVEDEESAEDIRRKVINYIMKEKLTKKK
jgi:parvulin-like peptidyl-prolyl isomerase